MPPAASEPDLTRRRLITRAAALLPAVYLGDVIASSSRSGSLALIDASTALGRRVKATLGCEVIDVAQDECNGWGRLRAWRGDAPVLGLTRWSAFLQARGVLQERGLRVRRESPHGELFYWEMA